MNVCDLASSLVTELNMDVVASSASNKQRLVRSMSLGTKVHEFHFLHNDFCNCRSKSCSMTLTTRASMLQSYQVGWWASADKRFRVISIRQVQNTRVRIVGDTHVPYLLDQVIDACETPR